MGLPILDLQRRAIDIIKARYGLLAGGSALVAALSAVIAWALGSAGGLVRQLVSLTSVVGASVYEPGDMLGGFILSGAAAVVALLGFAISLAKEAAAAPLTMGYNRIALQLLAGGEAEVDWLFTAFRSFWRYVGAVLWVSLWTALWSLLFIVPGIIKGLAYSQTVWLVARYPDLSVREAMRLSIRMTEGYKGDIFVAWLLIFAWEFLALVLACTLVGPLVYSVLWMTPLQTLLMSAIHRYLVESALGRGVVQRNELGPSSIPADNSFAQGIA